MKDKTPEIDPNTIETNLPDFLEYYNSNIPTSHPHATKELLQKFKETHESLFDKNTWTIDKHRKRLMDWLSSYIGRSHRSSTDADISAS